MKTTNTLLEIFKLINESNEYLEKTEKEVNTMLKNVDKNNLDEISKLNELNFINLDQKEKLDELNNVFIEYGHTMDEDYLFNSYMLLLNTRSKIIKSYQETLKQYN